MKMAGMPIYGKNPSKISSPELLKGFEANFIWSMWEPWWSYFAFLVKNAPATVYWLSQNGEKNDENFSFNNFSMELLWSCEKWSNETTFYETHLPKGMYVPRLSHIHMEKPCFQIKPPLIPLGPLGLYFIFNMLSKGNNKLSDFLCKSIVQNGCHDWKKYFKQKSSPDQLNPWLKIDYAKKKLLQIRTKFGMKH